MQFNSSEYLFFFIAVFFLFWFLFRNNYKTQNIFLLAANYIFYAWWDLRFLILIIFISLLNYSAALGIGSSDSELQAKRRKFFLISVLSINLLILGIFKYFNFFIQSSADLLHLFGIKPDTLTLNVILPIGISFYTFQAMGYIIDVYHEKIEPDKNIISFFVYISFFPLILAGPIERGGNLLPQINRKREFDYDEAASGMRQILWGVFKKIVIADNCAILANRIFNNYSQLESSVLIMGVIYFAFQIYGDFSGYSDIAIGSAKLLGFRLTTNFKTPYFSRDISEFWRRWHISLSTWFRDYLFIPLNLQLRNLKIWAVVISVMITFLTCGLWHGANWTYIAWGGILGVYFVPSLLKGQSSKNPDIAAKGKLIPSLKEIFQMGFTFSLVCFAWIFFKSESIGEALQFIRRIFSARFLPNDFSYFPVYIIFLLGFFILAEWFLFRKDNFLEQFKDMNVILRRAFYAAIIVLIFLFMQNEATSFIYFQF